MLGRVRPFGESCVPVGFHHTVKTMSTSGKDPLKLTKMDKEWKIGFSIK